MSAYFEENSPAMNQLESMVDTVGIRNVLYALSRICDGKAEHLAVNWQDSKTAKVWAQWSYRLDAEAARSKLPDPLAP